MRRSTMLLVGLLVVAILAAFNWMEFRIARSDTSADTNVVSLSSGGDPEQIKSAQIGRQIAIHVIGEDAVTVALAKELSDLLQADPRLVEVADLVFLDEPVDQVDRPTLLIDLTKRQSLWTPVYAQADVTVQMVYTSDGDLSWRNRQPVVMDYRGDGPVIWLRGDVNLSDRMVGVISKPAHQTELGRKLASEVSKSLQRSFGRPV